MGYTGRGMGRIIGCVLLFAFSTAGWAGKVYRCPDGSYQDKPCGQGERVIAHNNPQSPPPAGSDPQCFARGNEAARLVALRDKGRTVEAVLKEIDTSPRAYEQRVDEKAFVVKVFQTKGSAAEVRSLVEADCVSQRKNETAKAAAAPAPAQVEQPEKPAAKQPEGDMQLANLCKKLKLDQKRTAAKARKGGSADQMEEIAEHGRDIDMQLKELCE